MQRMNPFLSRLFSLAVVAALVTGCSGGSGSGGGESVAPVSPAPVVTLTPQATKQFLFTWEDVANEAEYRLLEKPNSMSGYTQVAVIPADTESYSHTVFLPERVNASYLLQACNSDGQCVDSEEQFVSGSLAEAVGYFKASNSEADDEFGSSIALSGDGRTLAVGALEEDSATSEDPNDNNVRGSGAVYVFTRVDGGAWSQTAYLKASNAEDFDRFGRSLALSADGKILAVGARDEDSATSDDPNDNSASLAGAVYVFTRVDGGAWSQTAYLKASNLEAFDYFGYSVALSGDGRTLVVGAFGEDSAISDNPDDNSAPSSGAVYVFTQADGGEWYQSAYVKASNADTGDEFGFTVALSRDGRTLAVGARGEDSATSKDLNDNSVSSSGAVYVFTRAESGAWSQTAYLKASNANAFDFFGHSVALSGDGRTLVVGAFGEDSAISDNPDDNSAPSSGAVYVFTQADGGEWYQSAYVKASNAEADDRFGASLALSGGGHTLAIGANREGSAATGLNGSESDNSALSSGAAYVFTLSEGGGWSQQAYVKSSNTDEYDAFGASVALSGDGETLAVGAPEEGSVATGIDGDQSDNSADFSGAVYLY